MAFYLDGELCGGDKSAIEAHLDGCRPCYEVFRNEGRFLEMIRQARPLHEVSPSLLHRVQKILGASSPFGRQRFARMTSALSRRQWAAAAVTAVAAAVIVTMVSLPAKKTENRQPPSEFALMAVDT